jgi:hypothetical protein
MKILAQFGIFIRIIILNIGGKKANTQLFLYSFKKKQSIIIKIYKTL